MPPTPTEAAVEPRRPTVTPATFATNGVASDPLAAWFVAGLCDAFEEHGYRRHPAPGPDTQIVLHVVDPADPKPYRRRAAPTFVVGIGAHPALTPLPGLHLHRMRVQMNARGGWERLWGRPEGPRMCG